MAHLLAFSLFLCLAGCLAHSTAALESTGLAKRVPSDQVYHVRDGTGYDAFLTSHSNLATLGVRDLYKQSDVLAQRDLMFHDSDKAAQYTGSTKLNAIGVSSKAQSDKSAILSEYSQTQRAISRRNLKGRPSLSPNSSKSKPQQPSAQNGKPKNANHNSGIHKHPHSPLHGINPKGFRPSTHPIGNKNNHYHGHQDFNSRKTRIAVQEASDLFKRNVAPNSHGLSHNIGTPAGQKQAAGHGKSSRDRSQSKHQVSALHLLASGIAVQNPRKFNNLPTPQRFRGVHTGKHTSIGLGERIAQHEAADLYKRGAATKGFLHSPQTALVGRGKPPIHNNTPERPKQQSQSLKHARVNFLLETPDMYRRDLAGDREEASDQLIVKRAGKSVGTTLSRPMQHPRTTGPGKHIPPSGFHRGSGRPRSPSKELRSNFQIQGSDVYKRDDHSTESKLLQASLSEVADPEILRRAFPKRPSTSQGSIHSLFQASDLYKKDANDDDDDDDEPDHLRLLLEYLDLQNSASNASTDESESNEEEPHESDTLQDLAISIQNLANGADEQQLEQRAVSAKRPAPAASPKPKSNPKPKTATGSAAWPQALSGWMATLNKQPKTRPSRKYSSWPQLSKGGAEGGMSAHMAVSGDEPY